MEDALSQPYIYSREVAIQELGEGKVIAIETFGEVIQVTSRSKKKHDIRVETLERIEYEVYSILSYAHEFAAYADYELSRFESSGLPLQSINPEDELSIDEILESNVQRTEEDEDLSAKLEFIIDLFKKPFEDSSQEKVDFVIPSGMLNPLVHENIVGFLGIFAKKVVHSPSSRAPTYVSCISHLFVQGHSRKIRRRTRGALSQPFDTRD